MSQNSSNSHVSTKWGRLISSIPTLASVALSRNSLKIGRGQICDIVLTESNLGSHYNLLHAVSKEHFVIIRNPESMQACLKDTSKNGTFLNGARVTKGDLIYLRHGDKIAIGHTKQYVYTFESAEELPDTLIPDTLDNTPKYTDLLPVWGRLLSCQIHLESYDLHKDSFKVGRSESCDLSIANTKLSEINKRIFSKEHFEICKDSDRNIAYIVDLSRGGTYLNNRLIGRNNMQILQHDDRISIRGGLQVFVYKCIMSHDASFLPPELKGRYEPSTILGKGGAGEVRLAYEKPFIISMRDIVETSDEVFIVLDYMRGGELTNRILSNVPMTESNVKFYFYQIMLAVEYLHKMGITHRDLKPENVLLDSEDIEALVNVTDFGLSKVTEGQDMMRTICGTMSYIAPEILDRSIPEYNRQVDVWSLGVILFYMLAKRLPFKSSDRNMLEKLIITGNYSMKEDPWKDITSHAKDLVKKMLTVKPENRITVKNILKHPWLTRDLGVQSRVKALHNAHIDMSEELVFTYGVEPAAKRFRSSSEDSSSSSSH